MKIIRPIYSLTFTIVFTICCLTNCGSSAEQFTDEEVERLAQNRFIMVRDTLSKQYKSECDSSKIQLVQTNVDSIIFEYYKNLDTVNVNLE